MRNPLGTTGLTAGRQIATAAIPTTPGFWANGTHMDTVTCTRFFRVYPEHVARRVLPAMFQAAKKVAEARAVTLRQSALDEMNRLLAHEVERLQSLAQVNNHIRPQEIQLARTQQDALAFWHKSGEQSWNSVPAPAGHTAPDNPHWPITPPRHSDTNAASPS